ncbi:MAG: YdcF family protein [Candidatus Omnitrophica bacterium]|nr:YdcF family protein [Candidatus Omnitrophota bacterium]
MLKNQNIICISSIDWDFIWQGHQEIMSALAENGNRVLFIENTGVRSPGIRDFSRIKSRIRNWLSGVKGIRKIRDNLYVYSPFLLPFPYLRIAVWFNSHYILSLLEKWTKAVNFNNPLIWTFLPTPLSLNLIESITHKLLVYYCIDNFTDSSATAKKIKASEVRLLEMSDLVFVTSGELFNYCAGYNQNTHIFPFGVNYNQFEEVRLNSGLKPGAIKNIKPPVIGYIGGIHKWLDLNLIKKMAMDRPDYSFVFVGPIQANVSSLSSLKNIYFLGQQHHEALPAFIKSFDACIIPYLITEYTKNVYPTKLNEYLAMGKPVVSTSLPEVVNFNRINDFIVFIGTGYEEFINSVDKAINDTSKEAAQKRIEVAKKNSWDGRISEMSTLIEGAIYKKEHLSFDWRDNFVKLFKRVKRKTFKIALLAGCLYLLIFYSPFVWFLAEPLRISQEPKKADAIVVFAGGVGESGKAGQGYEERVSRAVELYKEGYADKIIFSSGYIYFLEEASVMKAVAISLKVPESAIILEDQAKSTYENVIFTKEIIDKQNWKDILLVSSPYHMRRVSLVFNKIGKNIKVTCTPVPDSLFYAHPDRDSHGRIIWKRINLEQIKGIIHEYLGIVYYWWKGYS